MLETENAGKYTSLARQIYFFGMFQITGNRAFLSNSNGVTRRPSLHCHFYRQRSKKSVRTLPETQLYKMPGGGLTAPKKLSPELADIVGKKTASRAELMKLLWAYIKKNNLQVRNLRKLCPLKLLNICLPPLPRTPTTSSTSSPTRRWPRSSAPTRCAASGWPSTLAATCPKNEDPQRRGRQRICLQHFYTKLYSCTKLTLRIKIQ